MQVLLFHSHFSQNRKSVVVFFCIRNLELEKEKVSLAEKEKIDFLRTASHELKTPVTELNATLENMILGIGEYRDYETYLPKCKEITEQLGDMIRDILNASRLQTQGNNEPCSNFSLRTLLTELCEPYRLIAEAKGIKFKIELSSDAFVYLPEGRLKKAISNINEALFCEDFLRTRQIIFANGAFFTPDGRVTDDLPLRGEIFEELKYCAVNNIPRKISNIIEIMKLAAHVEDFPPEQDRIHLANGTLMLDGTFTEGKPDIVRNRLPVFYRPDTPKPVLWLSFLNGLLYPEDIPTLQEFIGYCLIPSNKGQRIPASTD